MPQAVPKNAISKVVTSPSPIDFCMHCLKPAAKGDVFFTTSGLPLCSECVKTCFKHLLLFYPKEFQNSGWDINEE